MHLCPCWGRAEASADDYWIPVALCSSEFTCECVSDGGGGDREEEEEDQVVQKCEEQRQQQQQLSVVVNTESL